MVSYQVAELTGLREPDRLADRDSAGFALLYGQPRIWPKASRAWSDAVLQACQSRMDPVQ
ncbi:hypothetical protein RKE32_34675 [Streptomyces sp. Li-HN-5-13]|nr:hypothetical protein RKE32_34675 [Streptomyces sp. Li-HN-5-13]